MELDITGLFAHLSGTGEGQAIRYAASAAELGENAAKITWDNAVARAISYPILNTLDEIEAGRSFLSDFGGFEDIGTWSVTTLNAAVIQFIAGEVREWDRCSDWDRYRLEVEKGSASGRMWRHFDRERVFYDLSN
jgi:hypothetical protein